MNIYIDDYYTFKRVIGYTRRNTKIQYVNTKYFDTRSTKLVGSNILHEYGHKLGFDHDFRRTKRRPFSICYQLNDIYERCYDKLMGTVTHDQKKVCKRLWYTFWLKKVCWFEPMVDSPKIEK